MEKIKKNDFITAVSIYSSRVSTCIATMDGEGSINIAGLGKAEGKLMGGKGVLDIDTLGKAIRDSLKMAEEEANVESPRAIVSISGGSIKSEKSRGIVKLGHRGEEITGKNVKDVLKIANTVPINIEREVIHSIPQDFIVDSQSGIKNPAGLYGVKLEVETLLITAHTPFLQNVIKSFNLAGVDVEDVAFSGIAASRSVLFLEDTVGKGVILMEIDNNFTSISVFFDNILKGIDIYPKSVIVDGALETLKERVDNIRGSKPISKLILAGGAYIHEDFIEKADSVFGIPSQMAYSRNIKGSAKQLSSPAYLASIGLALYGLDKRKGLAYEKGGSLLRKMTRRVSDFISEYF